MDDTEKKVDVEMDSTTPVEASPVEETGAPMEPVSEPVTEEAGEEETVA